jgi:hypothetical protein
MAGLQPCKVGIRHSVDLIFNPLVVGSTPPEARQPFGLLGEPNENRRDQ